MRFLSSTILSVAFGLTAAGTVAAQSPPNLTGTWVMVADKSNFGPMPAPQSRTDVIDHKGSAIVINRTQTGGPMGDIKATLTYGVDGKEYKNSVNGNEVTSILKWDGAVLVIESTVITPNGTASVTDRWSLSADGKTLTQERKLSMQGQEAAQTIVLAKQ
jgi:hypothetical protein